MPVCKEENSLKHIAFSLYDIYDHALAQDPRGHEIYNDGKLFLHHQELYT